MAFKMKTNNNEEKTKSEAKTALENLIKQINTKKNNEYAKNCIVNLNELKSLLETNDGQVAKFILKLKNDFDKTKTLSDVKIMTLNLEIQEFLKPIKSNKT